MAYPCGDVTERYAAPAPRGLRSFSLESPKPEQRGRAFPRSGKQRSYLLALNNSARRYRLYIESKSENCNPAPSATESGRPYAESGVLGSLAGGFDVFDRQAAATAQDAGAVANPLVEIVVKASG